MQEKNTLTGAIEGGLVLLFFIMAIVAMIGWKVEDIKIYSKLEDYFKDEVILDYECEANLCIVEVEGKETFVHIKNGEVVELKRQEK